MNPANDKETLSGGQLLSVVTPVYNAADYLPALYKTLQAQTHTCWEWVAVDDGSSDGSVGLLRSWAAADARVRCYSCGRSGSAKYPRDMGVVMARSRYVVCIDADDDVDADFLQKLDERRAATGADIVYATVKFVDSRGVCSGELPRAGFDRSCVYAGRNLVRETMPVWNIGCNGLYDKAVFTNLSYPERRTDVWMNSDEVDERIALVNARTVAFADTTYYYILRSGSVTSAVSPKYFHKQKTDRDLLAFIVGEFGRGSLEHVLASRQMFYNLRSGLAVYAGNRRRLHACRDDIYADMKANFSLIDPSLLSRHERRLFFGFACFRLVFILFMIKYSPAARYVARRLSVLRRSQAAQ